MTYSAEISLQTEHDSGSIVVTDEAELNAALDRVLAAGRPYHAPTMVIRERPRFGPAQLPDHGIKLAFDAAVGVGALTYMGATSSGEQGVWVTQAAEAVEATLYRDHDTQLRYPSDAGIPLDKWRAVLHELLCNGGVRPESVGWRTTDTW